MIRSYQDALTYLYENLPMFQRVGSIAYKKDLANTLRLCSLLGNPENKFQSVHVAGTNGKGSTSHMLAAVLQTAGYKTGLYTSPHLKQFTERIRINGEEIPQEFVVAFVNRIKPAIEEIHPSFFEITVAMAFDYFAQNAVDVAVIEVGLGGRLDSTNVITPLVSVITNISWDHKDILGDTLVAIAREKAGIIKKGVPVVISERQEEVADVFVEKSRLENAEIFFASDEYHVESDLQTETIAILRQEELVCTLAYFPLRGLYQRKNLPGVVKAVDILRRDFSISSGQLSLALENVTSLTKLKGRWQILRDKPKMVCDTAHNFSGVQEVVAQISSIAFHDLHIVWGMVKDKDVNDILSLLPRHAKYYFCQAKIPRALDAGILSGLAEKHGLNGIVVPDVNDAKKSALEAARESDFIFIGGSTFVVAEIAEI